MYVYEILPPGSDVWIRIPPLCTENEKTMSTIVRLSIIDVHATYKWRIRKEKTVVATNTRIAFDHPQY